MVEPEPDLSRIDAALLALRHLWARPAPGTPANSSGVELSTVWIVDALTRREADAASEHNVRDLATALDVAHSTASRLVDRAVAAGSVVRGRSGTDARTVTVALTPAGRALARDALAFRTRYLSELTTDWTAAERTTFADLLARFASAAKGAPPGQRTPRPSSESAP